MSRRAVIVLNPAGGRGRAGRMRPELERFLHDACAQFAGDDPLEWEIVPTSAPGSATKLAAEAAASGAEIVAAAGGDGTLNEVLNGVAGSQAALALLPMGTGNDFARTVGLFGDLRLAVETLVCGRSRPIDVGSVISRLFLNVAGCGFDAVVADRANRGPKWLTGTPAYIASVIATIAQFKAANVRLTLDGETCELRAMLCSVANAQTYGGGMRIAPNACLDDGLFDICLLAEAGVLEFLLAFPRVFRGTHTSHPKVTVLRARHIRIESEPPLPLLVDGEVIGATPADFEIVPGAVRFLFPAPGRLPGILPGR